MSLVSNIMRKTSVQDSKGLRTSLDDRIYYTNVKIFVKIIDSFLPVFFSFEETNQVIGKEKLKYFRLQGFMLK